MTLTEFFDWVSIHPGWVLGYFIVLPLLALIVGRIAGDNAIYSPWNYIFSALIYLVCVPGLFALTLNIYLFLFERMSILETDILVQWLPVLGMFITLPIIRKQVNLDFVPGFGRLSGLILMILVVLSILWVLDKTRIWFISYLPVSYVLLLFVVLLVTLYWATRKVFGSPYRSTR